MAPGSDSGLPRLLLLPFPLPSDIRWPPPQLEIFGIFFCVSHSIWRAAKGLLLCWLLLDFSPDRPGPSDLIIGSRNDGPPPGDPSLAAGLPPFAPLSGLEALAIDAGSGDTTPRSLFTGEEGVAVDVGELTPPSI